MTEKDVAVLLRKLFSYPEGPYVMEWLTELYQQYTFRTIIQSGAANAPLAMAYKAGQSDLVTTLQNYLKLEDEEEGDDARGDSGAEDGSDSGDDGDSAEYDGH